MEFFSKSYLLTEKCSSFVSLKWEVSTGNYLHFALKFSSSDFLVCFLGPFFFSAFLLFISQRLVQAQLLPVMPGGLPGSLGSLISDLVFRRCPS